VEVPEYDSSFERTNAVREFTDEVNNIHQQNCRSMLVLFNNQMDEDYLTCAELYRYLGEWRDCLKLLKLVMGEDLAMYKQTIRKYAELGNKIVQQVNPIEEL